MNDFAMPRLAQKWFGAPLMMHPGKAAMIADVFGPRVLGGPFNMGKFDDSWRHGFDQYTGEKLYSGPKIEDGVALIEIEGTLVDKGAWQGQNSGMTSYEALSMEVRDAMENKAVKAVVFEVDSPGGMVSGCFELAEEIHQLSQAKPTIAILTDMACSAAYLLASACGSIAVPKRGVVGSIGVIAVYYNSQEMAQKSGIAVTIFKAGDKKADWHPLETPRPEWAADVQADINNDRDEFIGAVCRYRSLSPASVAAQEAGCFIGEQAVEAGLADITAAPREVYTNFCAMYGTAA